MIRYEEIHKEHISPSLSEKEQDCVDMLEVYTDEEIRKQFSKSHVICLAWNKIKAFISDLGMWREPIVLKVWVELYSLGGWNLKQGEDSYDWFLTKK